MTASSTALSDGRFRQYPAFAAGLARGGPTLKMLEHLVVGRRRLRMFAGGRATEMAGLLEGHCTDCDEVIVV